MKLDVVPIVAALVMAAARMATAAENIEVDLAAHDAGSGVVAEQAGSLLRVRWPLEKGDNRPWGQLVLQLAAGKPLIHEIGHAERETGPYIVVLSDVQPATYLTVGERELSRQGWNAFFDNPPQRPHETYAAALQPRAVRLQSRGKRSTMVLDGLTAGPFRGELQITVYAGCPLVHVEAVVSTDQDSRAILYDAGLTGKRPIGDVVVWMDNQDKLHLTRSDAAVPAELLAVRHRAIMAGTDDGSVAIFPPPHQFLYPLDFAENYKLVWFGRGFQNSGDQWGIGIRQPPEGDKRFVPWINAPPGTRQRLGVFYLLSRDTPEAALAAVKEFTHGDRFRRLDGYRTFTSHYHVEHTLDYLAKQRSQGTTEVPRGLEEPGFVKTFKAHGVDIVHLAEFHVRHTPEFIAQRLVHLDTLHRECRRLSTENFLLLPGEEPNVQLGGHWISLFPRPVYWLLHPPADAPFERQVEGLGAVYAVRSPADVLRLMEKEGGLMWTAHPRTKSSFGFPDRYRDEAFYRSPHFIGAGWKAMPADLSLPRLGVRSLDLLHDMANWGQQKYILGEVDVFRVEPDYELYGHMNINYLKLDRLPRFDDGWQSIVDALRQGQFFVTTGEVLLLEFRIGGRESGQTLRLDGAAAVDVTATVEWTFPPTFAEVIWGDGENVVRKRIDLGEHSSFGNLNLKIPVDLKGATWARLEVWDVAANGAFTQPVWIEQ